MNKQKIKEIIQMILYILTTTSMIVFFTIASVKELQTDTKVSETLKEPKRALNVAQNDSIKPAGFYTFKSLSYLSANYTDTAISSYFSFTGRPVETNICYIVSDSYYNYFGNDTKTTFDRIEFQLDTHSSTSFCQLKNIYIYNADYTNYQHVYYYGSSSDKWLNSDYLPFYLGGIEAIQFPNDYINEVYPGAFFDFWTNQLYNASNIETYDISALNASFLISYVVSPNNVFICPFGAGWQGGGSIILELDFYFVNGGFLCDKLYFVFDIMFFTADNNGNITEWDNATYNGTGNLPYFAFTQIKVHRVNEFSEDNPIVHTIAQKPIMTYQKYQDLTDYQPVYMLGMPFNFISEDYKNISFESSLLSSYVVQPIGAYTFPAKNLSLYEVLNIKGDYSYNTSAGGADIGLSNVFVLFTTAFGSFLPILNISVIPGVTIGLLMFMPLVVTIIIVIIKLVKR